MAELRFNTDEGRTTRQAMVTAHQDISQNMSTLRASIGGLVGSEWIAPGANQFNDEFTQWATQIDPLLSELEALSTRLESEIQQWEETAARTE